MEDQEKSGSKPLDTPTESATSFVSSVEGEPVLLVEDVGISFAAFACTSNYGDPKNYSLGASSEERTTADVGTTLSADNRDHPVAPFNGEFSLDTRFNDANVEPDTGIGSMPCRTECFPYQPIGTNVMGKDDISGEKLVNESLLLQTECTPIEDHEVPSSGLELHSTNELPTDTGPTSAYNLPLGAVTTRSEKSVSVDADSDKRASLDVDSDRSAPAVEVYKVPSSELELRSNNELPVDTGPTSVYSLPPGAGSNKSGSVDVDGDKRVVDVESYKSLLLQTECTPNEVHEVPSPELELHINNELPADTGATVAYSFPMGAEPTIRNEELASVDVDVDKSALVDVQLVDVGDYDYIQATGETLVQDSQPTKITEISNKEAERMPSKDGSIVIVENSSVDAANTSNHLESTNTSSISSAVSETNLSSIVANLVNDNPPENTKFMSQVNIFPMSVNAEYVANGITDTHVVSSSPVDAADDVLGRLDRYVGQIAGDDPSAGAALDTGIRHPGCDQSMLEGKKTDFESVKDVDLSADAGHTIGSIDGVHDIIGQSGGDTVPVTDIEPSDKAKFSPKTQGHLDTVHGMISLDSNKIGTSTDKLPSMEPVSAPAAVTDEELGSDLNQEQDATQTPDKNSGEEVLVGQKVRKRFGNRQYMGEVVGFDRETSWYKVSYEDGDEEDLEQEELETILVQSKRGNSESRRQKGRSRSHTRESRSFKRVQRPIVSREKVRGGSISDRQKSVESGDLKDDNKCDPDNKDHSMVDSADRLSSPMRTAKKRHSEQVHATPKRRKADEDFPEHDQTTGTRATKRRKVDQAFPEHDQTTGTKTTKRRKVDGDFPEHDQTTGTRATKKKKVDEALPDHDQTTRTRTGKRKKLDQESSEHDQTTGTRTTKRGKVDEEFLECDHTTGTGTSKKRKVDEEFLEHDQTTGTRTRNRVIVETRSQREKNLTENKVSTRRNSASSAINLEAVSGSNVDVSNSIPGFHDGAKSDNLESSQKNDPPQGGGIALIGRKTKKDFGGQVYEGEVIDYDFKAKYYKVKYNDGDEEELEWTELKLTLVHTDRKPLSFKSMLRARNMAARLKAEDQSTSSKDDASKVNQTLVFHEAGAALNEQRKYPSVLEEVREVSHGKENFSGKSMVPVGSVGRMSSPPRPLVAARFASAGDADIYEYFCWGEVIGFDKAKCPELRAAKLLPTSSPIVHLAASQHHLAAITAAGQVWLWRNKHGNIHTRCNEWEHIASLEDKGVVLVDIAGPDLDRASGGYEAEQEDQVPDPFYLVAVGADGHDFILQSSQPQEPVRTYQLSDEPRHLSLKGVLSQSGHPSLNYAGQIVQVSVGTVEAPDESPFIGYITDTDHVYIRSATRDYMEEVNLVSGYTGKPIKIQCGRVYHAIIMTDDGRAWTWGRGYYPGLNALGSSGFSAATCQSAVGTLVGRKVIDVGCYGEDFIALTSDGDVHQWTHAVPNPAAGVYNVPATPLYGHGPCIPYGDKLIQVSIGSGMCAGITDGGRVHTWRTAMKGGLIGILVPEKEALTPLGHEESHKDTAIVNLGHRTATKVICVAGSLIVVVKKKTRGRMGPRKKRVKSNTESGIGGHS